MRTAPTVSLRHLPQNSMDIVSKYQLIERRMRPAFFVKSAERVPRRVAEETFGSQKPQTVWYKISGVVRRLRCKSRYNKFNDKCDSCAASSNRYGRLSLSLDSHKLLKQHLIIHFVCVSVVKYICNIP